MKKLNRSKQVMIRKCQEQNVDLYMTFVDITKAFWCGNLFLTAPFVDLAYLYLLTQLVVIDAGKLWPSLAVNPDS